jgi:hypothetical protein
VRREIARRGGRKPCLWIVRGLFAALADPAGVVAHRPGPLERIAKRMSLKMAGLTGRVLVGWSRERLFSARG